MTGQLNLALSVTVPILKTPFLIVRATSCIPSMEVNGLLREMRLAPLANLTLENAPHALLPREIATSEGI